MKSPRECVVLHLLRETENYSVYRARRGIRIVAKARNAFPRSRMVPVNDWLLQQTSDFEFDGTVVLELGIGTFQRK